MDKVPNVVDFPDVYVICLASAFDRRGAATVAYYEQELGSSKTPSGVGARVTRFDAITPADFRVEDVASTSQVAIVRGRAPRVTHADMSRTEQVACYLSHKALWQVCADSARPIVVSEDDAQPSNILGRIVAATNKARLVQEAGLATSVPKAQVPVVVLLQHHSSFVPQTQEPVKTHRAASELGQQVLFFSGIGAYYLTPEAARLLLKHGVPAAMHVDYFMATCIAAYNLAVYTLPGANDQSFEDTTLMHSANWDILVERQKWMISLWSAASICLLVWACVATTVGIAFAVRNTRQRK